MFIRYEIGERLGRGAWGTVHSATRIRDHFPVAVKIIPKKNVLHWVQMQDGSTVPREVAILERLGCVEGVVKLLDYYEREGFFHIVMEKHGPDLFDFIDHNDFLPESLSRRLFRQVVRTVIDCHRLGVVHGDIKDENIVLSDLNAKMIDFGLSQFLTPGLEISSGTLVYSPPETILRGKCDAVAGAVWSLGVLLYDMLTGDLPFEGKEEILRADVRFEGTELSNECRDLVYMCLQGKEENRPTLEEVREHEWLRWQSPL